MQNLYDKNELTKVLTSERLSSYGTDNSNILIEKYIYNLKLSEAFYPAISLLEVALRNRITSAIEKLYFK